MKPLFWLSLMGLCLTTCAVPSTVVPPPSTRAPLPTQPTRHPTQPPPTPTALAVTATPTWSPEASALLEQAKASNAERYDFAAQQGAQILPTSDGRSFYVLWTPPGITLAAAPLIVTLHGHGSWALDEFYLWQPYAAQRGYGVLALQWWFGGGETTSDYYQSQAMYVLLRELVMTMGVPPGRALLHGFSRGATNTYGLNALDRQTASPLFNLTIANAGGVAEDFPINADIVRGEFGASPLGGTHWILVCGAQDPNPDRDGCPAMERARDWIGRYGGAVELLIEDPAGAHGAFHRNPDNVSQALDVAALFLK